MHKKLLGFHSVRLIVKLANGIWLVGDLRGGRLPAAQGLLKVIQSTGNFIRKCVALFTQNDVLVVCPCEISASAEALPQDHGRDMYICRGASHTSF